MTMLLLAIIGLTLLFTSFAGPGREESVGMTRWMGLMKGVGVLLAVLLPSWTQTVLLFGILINLQRMMPPSSHLNFYTHVLAVVGGYLLLVPYAQPWMVEPFLLALVGLGVIYGVWTVYTTLHTGEAYSRLWQWGWVKIHLHEFEPWDIWCGQLNTNFLQAMISLSLAATVGLLWTGTSWVWWCLPLQVYPLMYWIVYEKTHLQWVVNLSVLGVVLTALLHPWVAMGASLIAVSALIWALLFRYLEQPTLWWHDSGRLEEWHQMLREWWRVPNWWTTLFGCGIRSWAQVSAGLCHRRGPQHPNQRVFAMAHNEFIQQFFEYGVVGGIALLGYIGVALWKAYAVHTGLFLVAVVLVSIATMTFPWAFYHKVLLPKERLANGDIRMETSLHGSPALFWVAFLISILVEA